MERIRNSGYESSHLKITSMEGTKANMEKGERERGVYAPLKYKQKQSLLRKGARERNHPDAGKRGGDKV